MCICALYFVVLIVSVPFTVDEREIQMIVVSPIKLIDTLKML